MRGEIVCAFGSSFGRACTPCGLRGFTYIHISSLTRAHTHTQTNKEVSFDIETAIKCCRAAGYFAHALVLAKKHHKHDWYVCVCVRVCLCLCLCECLCVSVCVPRPWVWVRVRVRMRAVSVSRMQVFGQSRIDMPVKPYPYPSPQYSSFPILPSFPRSRRTPTPTLPQHIR